MVVNSDSESESLAVGLVFLAVDIYHKLKA